MKAEILGLATVVLLCGCTSVRSSKDAATMEPDQTFINLFAQYNQERRSLPISGLEDALRAWMKSQSDEDLERAERIYRNIDVSRVMNFRARKLPSGSTYECLRQILCGSYAVATMKSWAIAQFTPVCIRRGLDGRWVELRYQGTSEDGMSAYGNVEFVKEGDEWKIGFESFGGSESEHNKLLQPACEDARG